MRSTLLTIGTCLALLPARAQTSPGVMGGGYDGLNRNQAAAEDRNRATRASTAQQAERAAGSSGNSSSSGSSGSSVPAYDPTLGDRLRDAQASSAAQDLQNRLAKSQARQEAIARKAAADNAQTEALLRMINSPGAIAAEKRRELEKANAARIDQLVVPYRQAWVKQGFSEGEAHQFAGQTTSYDAASGQLIVMPSPAHTALQQARSTFAAAAGTAPLDTLLELAQRFAPAGYTAAHQLQSLTPRFPARRRDIDLATLQALSYFWSKPYPVALTNDLQAYNSQAWDNSEANQQEMLTLFEALVAKYPTETLQAVAQMGDARTPFQRLGQQAEDQKDNAKAAAYYAQTLRVPYSSNAAKSPARRYESYPSYYSPYSRYDRMWWAFRAKGAKSPVAKFRDADWAALGRAQGVPVAELMGYLLIGHGCGSTLGENYNPNRKLSGSSYAEQFYRDDYPQILRRLGEAGDAQALNDYAVLVAAGNLRGQDPATAPALLEKAAAAGSVWAAVNLYWAPRWNLPGYSDRATGEARLNQYLARATPQQLVSYARILGGLEGGQPTLYNRSKAREIAAQVVAAGLPEGQALLKELK